VIGLDTNILIRHVMQDDPAQSERASNAIAQFTEDDPAFISLITIVESVWVLRTSYRLDTTAVSRFIDSLLAASEFVVQAPDVVRRAMTLSREHQTEFADAVIAMLGIDADCDETLTFDRRASDLPGMRLLT
jgi:predicted nucleic-acid-binding protein